MIANRRTLECPLHKLTTTWLRKVASAKGYVSRGSIVAVDRAIRRLTRIGWNDANTRWNACVGDFVASCVPVLTGGVSANDTAQGMTAPDYAENAGWTTDGSSKYIKTGYIFNSLVGAMGVYFNNSNSSSGTNGVMGARDGAGATTYRIFRSGPAIQGGFGNNTGGNPFIGQVTTPAGLTTLTRASSTSLTMYQAGVSIGTNAAAATPGNVGVEAYVLAHNNAGPVYLPSGSTLNTYFMSTIATPDEVILNNIIQALQASLGRQR